MKNGRLRISWISWIFVFAAISLIGCSESNKNDQTGSGGSQPYSGSGGGGGVGGQAGTTPTTTSGTGGVTDSAGAGGTTGGTAGTSDVPPVMDSGAPDGSAGTAGTDMAGAGGTADTGASGTGGGTGSKYDQPGSFTTTMEANVGPNNNYTVFRPDPLGANGFVHSPLIFGPGIMTTASNYTVLLTHLASHGFVCICVNSMDGGPNDAGNLSDMKTGLEWLIAQNSAGGIYQDKLAVDRAIAMGYSIGATASVQLCSHPAIMTTVAIHGHNTSGDPHGPVLLLTGTQDVITDVRTTLTTLTEAPAMMTGLPITHIEAGNEFTTGRYVAPITAWLLYWAYGDDDAKRYFWGADCEMCKSPWITPETNDKWKAQTL
jgi:hypothetical protein